MRPTLEGSDEINRIITDELVCSVFPPRRNSLGRAMWFSAHGSTARSGTDPERDEKFESGLLRW
jgi:hypothetical protein